MIIVRCAKTVDACDWLSLVYRNEADTTLGGILISVSKLVREGAETRCRCGLAPSSAVTVVVEQGGTRDSWSVHSSNHQAGGSVALCAPYAGLWSQQEVTAVVTSLVVRAKPLRHFNDTSRRAGLVQSLEGRIVV